MCGATIDTANGEVTCVLDDGHDGPHSSSDGQEWTAVFGGSV